MNKKLIIASAILIISCFTLAFTLYNLFKASATEFAPLPADKIVYLEQECKPQECPINSFIPKAPTQSGDVMIAKVFGTIYEDTDNVTVFGTCSDSSNHPKDTNATVTIYNQDTTIYINQQNMTEIDTGRFNYTTTLTTRGNFLVELNCTAGSSYAVAYTEFQNPNWVNKIQTALDNIATLLGTTTKSDFEIDKLAVVSPIYPNESIIVELTFSNENGTLITPDTINLTIFKPDKSLFVEKAKADFDMVGNVWNYSKVLGVAADTGTYHVHVFANYSAGGALKEAVKTTQFRVATGGPYSLTLSCPSAVEQGQELDCTVTIIDEGEIGTESITTVWIDNNGNGVFDSGEVQSGFSKKTEPQQTVNQLVSLNVPFSHDTGVFTVYATTSYANSQQPDSSASDTITILAVNVAGGIGGGGFANCNNYILLYEDCFYLNYDGTCVRGCDEGYTCQNLVCVPSEEILPIVTMPSWWDRLINWIKTLLGTDTQLTPQQQSEITDKQVEQIRFINTAKQIVEPIKQNPILALIIAGIILLIISLIQFGPATFLPPIVYYFISYSIIVFMLWYFKVLI